MKIQQVKELLTPNKLENLFYLSCQNYSFDFTASSCVSKLCWEFYSKTDFWTHPIQATRSGWRWWSECSSQMWKYDRLFKTPETFFISKGTHKGNLLHCAWQSRATSRYWGKSSSCLFKTPGTDSAKYLHYFAQSNCLGKVSSWYRVLWALCCSLSWLCKGWIAADHGKRQSIFISCGIFQSILSASHECILFCV